MHYGPLSYCELGRVHPRDRLRESFPREWFRKRLGVCLIPVPSPPPPPSTPSAVWIEPPRSLTWIEPARSTVWVAPK